MTGSAGFGVGVLLAGGDDGLWMVEIVERRRLPDVDLSALYCWALSRTFSLVTARRNTGMATLIMLCNVSFYDCQWKVVGFVCLLESVQWPFQSCAAF